MARVPRAISPVYVPCLINQFIFGQWVVATTAEENHQITNLNDSQARSSAGHHLVYFDNRYGNHSEDGIFDIATLTMHFFVKSSLFVNVTLHTMADIDVTNVVVFDVIRALIRVALNRNRNAVYIRSPAFCFILTVAIYSSFLYTLSISRLFWVITL